MAAAALGHPDADQIAAHQQRQMVYVNRAAVVGFDVAQLFKNVERYEVRFGDQLLVFPAELNKTQKQVLKLLEVPIAAYQ